ncbi:hypothetical protein APT58_08370 [Corynebacterium glutamicum]|nr:hypothetical protein APT58_08370 [Corynebacterium glutamicum]
MATQHPEVDYSIPLPPGEIEVRIRHVSARIEDGAMKVHRAELEYLEAERALKHAKATRYLAHRAEKRSIKDAEALTVLDTQKLRDTRDNTKAAWEYSRTFLRALESTLSGLQTQAAGIRAAYPNVQRGLP